jgi:chromosome segregation ATPase
MSLSMDDVGGSSNTPVEVDISDIALARQSLNELEEDRRSFAVLLRAEQRQFLASRDFLAQQRREVMESREELSHARAELEWRSAELEERERGLVQCEVAVEVSGIAEELQQQLSELRTELDSERTWFEQERQEQMSSWHKTMADYEGQIRALNDQIRDMWSTNEGLRQQVSNISVAFDSHCHVSRNTALELDRLSRMATEERDQALEL